MCFLLIVRAVVADRDLLHVFALLGGRSFRLCLRKIDRHQRCRGELLKKHFRSFLGTCIGRNFGNGLFRNGSDVFREDLIETFGEFYKGFQSDYARRLLESGQFKVLEVSRLLGFSTPDYFTRVFKKHTGETPSAVKR